jgi:hypothetical protein
MPGAQRQGTAVPFALQSLVSLDRLIQPSDSIQSAPHTVQGFPEKLIAVSVELFA